MKPMNQMKPTEKAKLLHELFPKEINQFLEFLKTHCAEILLSQDLGPVYVERPFEAVDWIIYVEEVEKVVKRDWKTLASNNQYFADALFENYLQYFSVDSLLKFIDGTGHSDFTHAVLMCFGQLKSMGKKILKSR